MTAHAEPYSYNDNNCVVMQEAECKSYNIYN